MTERERAVYCRAWRRSAGIIPQQSHAAAVEVPVCWASPCGLFDLGYDVALPASMCCFRYGECLRDERGQALPSKRSASELKILLTSGYTAWALAMRAPASNGLRVSGVTADRVFPNEGGHDELSPAKRRWFGFGKR